MGTSQDDETGMQLLGHRYYLPKLGRFLTQDPIGQEGGLNLYEYCSSNPLSSVDPDGRQRQNIFGTSNPMAAYNQLLGPLDLNAAKGAALKAAADLGRPIAQVGWWITIVTSNFDPSPFSDLTNAGLSSILGDNAGASASLIAAALPFVSGTSLRIASHAFAPGKWFPHFEKHGAELGFKTSVQYLRGAQDLIAGGEDVLRHTTKSGDVLFYRQATNEFAVLGSNGRIRTYFSPTSRENYWEKQLRR